MDIILYAFLLIKYIIIISSRVVLSLIRLKAVHFVNMKNDSFFVMF